MPDDYIPKTHHLDRRAVDLLEKPDPHPDDRLLNTQELAEWLRCSPQLLAIARHRGYGPRFVRPTARTVRYRMRDVREWLAERCHQSTSEYTGGRK